MRLVFWPSLSLVLYAYAGYPIWIYVGARFWPLPIRRKEFFSSVPTVVAVHNEEINLPRKFHNLAQPNYPSDELEIIVVSDGPSDGRNGILRDGENSRRQTVILRKQGGKATALNSGIASAKGESR